ncbi:MULTISPECIES: LysE family translocator [Nitrospirillum]|uniref:Threonine/homoserine/homoserine lactone efflux protein n=1 Tax=Nitrospirillum amazonense TaxID=28077 RepID=A0A560G5E4_9PROT|nr:LysE family translocator [Nitrospirillum amazonense]MEC4592883.1 LysE family translocator [Nitrospirillum amazonense]TWB29024.1 threonine/homoserine/homoserine lactone efflux protein [Nitrospirillum amazonense]
MLPLETLLTFITAAAILAFVPGPDNLFVLTLSAARGWRAGVMVTLGLCTGLVVHTTAVALGVAVIFQQSQLAFTLLKAAGAAYLLYLAYKSFRASPEVLGGAKAAADRTLTLYGRGIVMNVTNPKVAIFFLAFLPQFAAPEHGSVTVQIFLLGAVFAAVALACFSTIAVLAGGLNRWLARSSSAQTILNRIAGVVFIGLAIKLATAQR